MSLPRLHPRTIEAVKERADIVDVVGEHVVLKKKGREYVGICPFHDDTSPSMTVSPAKQFYYCFSCGAGGNAIKFLMEHQRQSFSDVVLELARKYQLPIETLDGPQQERLRKQLSRREQLHRVLTLAAGWFRSQLRAPEGAAALTYLRESRGLSEATLEAFELGFAPDRWDGLLSHLQQVEGLGPELLEEAGLVVPRKGASSQDGRGFYDRFRGRVMVPIKDRQGRVIGFGGRSLDGGEPKYLNSPETEVFEKGKHLFGLDKAAASIRKDDRAVVVEGYFDVIALHAAGITNAVASLGTALSSQQITQLCRCCEGRRIVLNFDSDGAGVRAAQRAIGEVEQLALQGQLELRVLQLPSGKDPDEFLKSQGAGDYRALLDQAPLWLDWQIEQVLEGRDLARPDQFQLAVTALVALLGKLPQSAVRSHYLQRVAERLSGGQARLAIQLEDDLRQQVKGQRWHGRSQKWELPGEAGLRERAEAEVLRMYLHCPNYRSAIRVELRQRELDDFALKHHRLLWAAISGLEEVNLGVGRLEAINRGHDPGSDLADLDLPRLLGDQLVVEQSALLSRLTPLLEPNELQRMAFSQPLLQLRGATASLERQKSVKRCRHLLDAWSSQRLETLERCIALLLEQEREEARATASGLAPLSDMESRIEALFSELNSDALRFQELYYNERKHLEHLDSQRRAGYEEVMAQPAA
ncbi:DNA primase [Cyanobium sp. T1G-Tous]|uniref:DNA primase n=1 Tax=unclassified Cyanobium TaxID=2627006 RepID=UPI0020CB6CCB|nr:MULTISPECIES: DNA primase [unclassified Cyanobium]MCP9778073.1 DNA primase [Cyanobium sp. Tous-M-B4]MCP9802831.1 DNA primase [Cyanobium sp. T1G-Tous]MCP9875029.1 DNA primase [Cyanobium sp. A2C-AMD]